MKPRPAALIAHIQGGLGNQLFCYAMARAMSLRLDMPLRIDTRSGYHNEKYNRDCLLRHFKIDTPEAGWWESFRGPLGRSRRSLAKKTNRRRPLEDRWLIRENTDARFQPELLDLAPKRTTHFNGHWQDERYFADAGQTLRQDFTLRDTAALPITPALRALVEQPTTVSVHCRSYGEVTAPPPGLQITPDYYRNAFATILQRVPDAHLLVFSDNPAWAKSLITLTGHDERATYVENDDPDSTPATLADFYLMSRCRHHVIGNSSFSWWTAWLGEGQSNTQNEGQDPIVTAPPGGLPGNPDATPPRWLTP